MDRSRSGHLAQITILGIKFEALLETLSSLTEESDRPDAIIQLDQIASGLNYHPDDSKSRILLYAGFSSLNGCHHVNECKVS